jgi:NADPH:quinone reductase-like Zn-dependent oxidoreductase
VLAVGEGVRHLHVGDRVLAPHPSPTFREQPVVPLSPGDWVIQYVPWSAVRSSGVNGVYLNLTRAELRHDRYAASPEAQEPTRATEMERSPRIIIHGVDAIECSEEYG